MVSGKKKIKYTLDEAKYALGTVLFEAWLKNAKKLTTESEEKIIEKVLLDLDNILLSIKKSLGDIELPISFVKEDSRPEEAYR